MFSDPVSVSVLTVDVAVTNYLLELIVTWENFLIFSLNSYYFTQNIFRIITSVAPRMSNDYLYAFKYYSDYHTCQPSGMGNGQIFSMKLLNLLNSLRVFIMVLPNARNENKYTTGSLSYKSFILRGT